MTKKEQQRIRQLENALRNKKAQNRPANNRKPNQPRKKNKPRVFNNSNAGVRIPPIAVGKNIRATQGGSKRFSGTDFINVTTVPVAAKSGDVIAQPIITANSGTRLSQVTQMYQKWTPRTLSFEFSGTGATTTPGMMAAGFVRDPDEEVPTDNRFTLAWLMNQEGSIMFKNWSDGKVTVNCNEKLFTSNGGSDKRFWTPGKLVIIAATGTGGQPVDVMVTMKWTVDVELPSNEQELDAAGPLQMTLTQDLRLKAQYFTEVTGDNEDVHFAVFADDQSSATLDPRTWNYNAFVVDGTVFADLPDGAIIKSSVPWLASYDFAVETPSIVVSSNYMVLKRQIDVFNGSYNTHVEAKANCLMPAWKIGNKLFLAGTVGAAASRLKNIGSDAALPAGTILTYQNPNLTEVEETISLLERGCYVTKPTGRKLWKNKDTANGYVNNYTQEQINRMPIVRVIANSLGQGIPVDIVHQEAPVTVVVKGDDTNSTALNVNMTQIGGVDIPTQDMGGCLPVGLERGLGTAAADPIFVSALLSNNAINLAQVGGHDVDTSKPGLFPIGVTTSTGTLDTSATVGNFPTLQKVDVTQVNSNDINGESLPVAGSVGVANFPGTQPISGTVTVTGSVGVNNFPTTQPVSLAGNIPVNITQVKSVDLTEAALPVSGGLSGDVNIAQVGGTDVPDQGGVKFLPTQLYKLDQQTGNYYPAAGYAIQKSDLMGNPAGSIGAVDVAMPIQYGIHQQYFVDMQTNPAVLTTGKTSTDTGAFLVKDSTST